MKDVIISPSILNVKKEDLDTKIKELKENSISWVHFDVMDGVFVPNVAYTSKDLEELSKHSLFNDVHLMCVNLEDIVDDYISSGASLITFHYEAIEDSKINSLIKRIKDRNVKVGMSIKPNTEVEILYPYLDKMDLVLVMSVEPGYGGQKFIESSIAKINQLNDYRNKHQLSYLIEVDGGINNENSKTCIENGADILVAGSYIFNGDIKERINSLR